MTSFGMSLNYLLALFDGVFSITKDLRFDNRHEPISLADGSVPAILKFKQNFYELTKKILLELRNDYFPELHGHWVWGVDNSSLLQIIL